MNEDDDRHSDIKSLNEKCAEVQKKIGVALLSDEDFLLLACAEIARTYTRDEINYQ